MKIIGGQLKGRNFFIPAGIRPTLNMARKAVFDIVGHDLKDIEFLELFAGSGAVSLEAFSRGCRRVTCVERDSKCARVIEENCELLGINTSDHKEALFESIQVDAVVAIKMFAQKKKKFDLIFLDPPYAKGVVKKALKTLMAYDILAPKSIVIVEYSTRETLPDLEGRFSILKQGRYGKTCLAVCQSIKVK